MFRRISVFLALFAFAGWAAAPAVAKDDPGFVQFRGSSFPVKEEAGVGLAETKWLEPADSGFYQPIILARRRD